MGTELNHAMRLSTIIPSRLSSFLSQAKLPQSRRSFRKGSIGGLIFRHRLRGLFELVFFLFENCFRASFRFHSRSAGQT
jgi:hypothetical protein